MRSAAIILARTTMPDFATSWHSTSAVSGLTRTPYARTGKSVLDDFREGKHTVLAALDHAPLRPAATTILRSMATAAASRAS
ncbi:hypothetical protein ACIBJC_06850 [Streptomyces sp. NPDC050509]|uniref:hypothetical protein n=1 Tax=Streptomyces sp. NPDC050509 TaxID=3365620 RepID=UPI0037BD7476